MVSPGAVLPSRVRESYLLKFALAGVLLVGVVAGFGYVVHEDVERILTTQTEAELATTAERRAATFHQWLTERQRATRMVSEFREVRSENQVVIRRKLQLELRRQPASVTAFHYVDLDDGDIVASTDSALEGRSIREFGIRWRTSDGSLQVENAADVAVSNAYAHNGTTAIAFLSPVVTNEAIGRGDRAVVMTVDTTSRAEAFRVAVDGGYTQVVDDRRTVTFDAEQSDTLGPYPYVEEVGLAGSGLNETVVRNVGEQDLLVAAAPVDDTDWTVVTHAPTTNAYAVRSAVRTDVSSLVLVTVLGVLAFGLAFGRNTVVVIERLASRATSLERGHLDVDVETDRVDEIGQLYSAFGAMRDSLRERIRETERASEELADINDRLESQKRVISVLYRVLKHHLRNELHVIKGNAERIQVETDEFDAPIQHILDHADALLAQAEEASRVERMIEGGIDAAPALSLRTYLDRTRDRLRQQHDHASFLLEGDPGDVSVAAHEEIDLVLAMLVRDVLAHSDSETPTVRFETEASEDTVDLRIRDDGPGVPRAALETLREEGPDAIRYGRSLGVWLADWILDHADGELRVEDDDTGTAVVVQLCRAETDDADGSATADTGVADDATGE